MDIDEARSRIMQAPDVPAVSDVLLKLLALVSKLDDDIAGLRLRVQDLERTNHQRTDMRIGGKP